MPVAARSPHPSAPQTSAIAAELGGVTARLRRALRRKLREELLVDPLPAPAMELLSLVARQSGLRVGDAARELVVAPNTASTLVARLVALGFLARLPDEGDGRVARLALMPAGADRLATWRDHRHVLLTETLDRLTPTDRRAIACALHALGALVEVLERREPS